MSLRKLGRYDIVRVLGKGAMGIVYEGRDPNLERRVAIKTVKVENLSEEAATEYEARFRTEARSAARLQHPNIVSVYDSDRHGDVAFLVMEYIQGDDLKQHLDRGVRYSLEQSLRMIGDLLSGLDYAHRQGIVHRDIKPANLLIEPGGRVKLTDFGVARIEDGNDATRTQGAMVGTLKYMAPEQVQGHKSDARADLFAVGVLLYQLLTDRRPFDGDNEFSIIQQIVGHTPAPPSSINPRLPAAIDAVVARALAKDRAQRFATAGEFAAALRSAVRNAEDATVMPPADPARRAARLANAGGYSTTSPGTSPMGSATVTQEVELVYWKDVKDSTDAEELELFLAKFPAGIYADLARRRLRRLAAGYVPDQTVPTGMAPLEPSRPSAAAMGGDPVPTMPLQARTARVQAVAAPAGAADALEAGNEPSLSQGGEPSDFPATVQDPSGVHARPSGVDLTIAPVAGGSSTRVDQTTVPLGLSTAPGTAAAATPPRKPSMALFAGAGVVVVGALVVVLLLVMGRGGSEQSASSPLSAASAPAQDASAALAAARPASASAAVVHTDAARRVAASAPASAAKRAAVSVKTATSAPPPAVEAPPRPAPDRAPAAPQVREEIRSAQPAPAPVRAPVSNPAEACNDKVFLSREFCLAEQCDKPGARNHPLCVQRREDARLREESKVWN